VSSSSAAMSLPSGFGGASIEAASMDATVPVQPAPPVPPLVRPFPSTLKNALNYAFINIWWAWIWFAVVHALFQGSGVPADGAGFLSIGTFVGGCLWLGHRKTAEVSRPKPISVSPTVITVPCSSPTPQRHIAAQLRRRWQQPPVSPRPVAQTGTRFVGHRVSMVFHEASCEWARKISSRIRTTFGSPAEARSRGFRPCQQEGCVPVAVPAHAHVDFVGKGCDCASSTI
jgi:hypothetical protein